VGQGRKIPAGGKPCLKRGQIHAPVQLWCNLPTGKRTK
jgi:hypothetical protein